MKFKQLHPESTMPSRGTLHSCGYDLFALAGGFIPAGERLLIPTGITWEIENPEDWFLIGNIKPRSGLAYKKGMHVLGGVIDADYTGDIGVILLNTSDEDFTFKAGDAVAQMVISKYETVSNDEYESTVRGDGGYNSTGR